LRLPLIHAETGDDRGTGLVEKQLLVVRRIVDVHRTDAP